MHPAVLVGVGGAIGSIARWGVAEILPVGSETQVPWATVAVNLLGAFLLGVLMASSVQTETALLLGTGLLGGFTTMSAFGLEAARLLQAGSNSAAGIYILLNLLAPITAWLGWNLSEAIIA
tara:strand:+ start:1876 stop:2238 length:363 start_codon:yes stop_codon:yes gene_type:complete